MLNKIWLFLNELYKAIFDLMRKASSEFQRQGTSQEQWIL